MRRCAKCDLEFTGDLRKCPLCQTDLTGEAEPSAFPYNKVKKSGVVALRVLGFATGVCLLAMLFLERPLAIPGDIVLAVCLALVMNYLFVRNILTHSPDFLRVVARYFLILLAIAVIWFLVTRNLAVTTYVIPGICLVALVFDAVLVALFRDTFVSGYAKYLLFDIVLGLTPLALMALGLTTRDTLALTSAFVASVFFLGLLVFMGRQLLDEIRKLFSA